MSSQLPAPASRRLEIAELRLCLRQQQIHRGSLLRRGVTTMKSGNASRVHSPASFDLLRSFNIAAKFLQRCAGPGAAVGGGGGLAIVDVSKQDYLRTIASFNLLFLQINEDPSAVLFFQSSQSSVSWSRSVKVLSKVLISPSFAGFNQSSRSRSEESTSAVLVDPSSVAIAVPGADPWKTRAQCSLILRPHNSSWSRSMKKNWRLGICSGACCVTALIEGEEIIVSNLGDCRAVLCRSGVAEVLTRDHRAGQEDERRRIEDKGGYVEIHRGAWRVHGVLSVSRSIGDAHLKDWVVAEPDTKRMCLTADLQYLVLASDGLWDKVENQEAIDMVMQSCQPEPKDADLKENVFEFDCISTSPSSKLKRISLVKSNNK